MDYSSSFSNVGSEAIRAPAIVNLAAASPQSASEHRHQDPDLLYGGLASVIRGLVRLGPGRASPPIVLYSASIRSPNIQCLLYFPLSAFWSMSSFPSFSRFRNKRNSAYDIYVQPPSLSAAASRSTTSISPTMTSTDGSRPGTAFREEAPVLRHVANNSQPVARDFQARHELKNAASHAPDATDPPQAAMSSNFEMGSDDDEANSAPPDIGNRAIHIPIRTT